MKMLVGLVMLIAGTSFAETNEWFVPLQQTNVVVTAGYELMDITVRSKPATTVIVTLNKVEASGATTIKRYMITATSRPSLADLDAALVTQGISIADLREKFKAVAPLLLGSQ
jgi:hypothetical protein